MSIKDIFSKKRIRLLIIGMIIVLIILSIIFIIARMQMGNVEDTGVEVEEEFIPPQSTLFQEYDLVSGDELIKSSGKKEENIIPELLIKDEALQAVYKDRSESIYYYSGITEEFIEYSINNNSKSFLLPNIKNSYNDIFEIIWSPNRNQVIIRTDKGYFLINITSKEIKTFNRNIYGPVWSPDGSKIVYQYLSLIDNTNIITVADPDGTNWRNIAELDLDELAHIGGRVILDWSPDSNYIYYTYEATNIEGLEIYSIDVLTGKISIQKDLGTPFGYEFSPDKNKILYTHIPIGGDIPEVWVMDSNGNNKTYTGIDNLTSKCVWRKDNINIICAISKDIYAYNSEYSDDILAEYNIKTGKINQLTVSTDIKFDVSGLIINNDDSILYYSNIDGSLYSLELN